MFPMDDIELRASTVQALFIQRPRSIRMSACARLGNMPLLSDDFNLALTRNQREATTAMAAAQALNEREVFLDELLDMTQADCNDADFQDFIKEVPQTLESQQCFNSCHGSRSAPSHHTCCMMSLNCLCY